MFDAWKQRQRQRLENRPERTVFYNIFATMMLVLAVELLMAVASILAINVTEQLDENAKDLLTMRVRNRASYVQEILRNAEDLEQLSEQITTTTQQLLKSGDISLDTLDNSSEQSDALLVALAPQLLDTLRTKQVTGIFIMLNTHDLDTCEVGKKMPGIYLRDLDPDARPSERNSDLLLERASATVVKELGIGTDKGWQPAFPYQGDTKGGILRTVFQAAYKSGASLSAENYGRWTTNSYCLAGDDRNAIAYSLPLILPDGTVYGVVGVELLTDYLQTKLPFTELDEDKAGTYFIVTTTDDALTDDVLSLRKTVTSGEDLVTADAPLGVLNCRSDGNGGNWAELNGKRYDMVLEPLQLYNRNAPFAAEKWFLAGTMEQSVLLAFSNRVHEVLLATLLFTLVLSVLGSLLVSARLARPINHLYREVIDAQEKKTFPHLSRTAIREVDRFAETITELNRELVTNSTKFLRIMDMASVEIGGYELRTDTGSVFVTDNFFPLLGMPKIQGKPLSVRRFEEVLKGIREKNPCDHTAEGDELLTIQQPDGVRYIMLRSTIEGHAKIGLAEDVTAAVLERKRIEHERDHDILTGLYNRQAFNRLCTELFATPERMGVAALMMMDLDNLKHINDTYGHDWGDQYIRRTSVPAGQYPRRDSLRTPFRRRVPCAVPRLPQPGRSAGKDRLPDEGHAAERGAATQRQRLAHQPFRRYCVVPGRWAGLGDLKKIRRLCHVSGQAFGEGPGGGVRHRGVQPRSLRRAHPQGVPAAAQQCAGVLLLPAHLLGAQRQGSRLRGADALRPAHPALPGHHHEAGAGAGGTVRDRAPHLYQGAGDLRQPVPGGQCVRGCHALCQLHRQHLPDAGGC